MARAGGLRWQVKRGETGSQVQAFVKREPGAITAQ